MLRINFLGAPLGAPYCWRPGACAPCPPRAATAIFIVFLPPLHSQCLPLADEICRHSLNFIKTCICNNSSLVRAVTNYGIQYGRYNSILGHNMLYCAQVYNSCVQDIISGTVNSIVNNHTVVCKSLEPLAKFCFFEFPGHLP